MAFAKFLQYRNKDEKCQLGEKFLESGTALETKHLINRLPYLKISRLKLDPLSQWPRSVRSSCGPLHYVLASKNLGVAFS